ncbi:MAG: hypothetical protein ACI9SG_001455, partial [Maribacter sp.]
KQLIVTSIRVMENVLFSFIITYIESSINQCSNFI